MVDEEPFNLWVVFKISSNSDSTDSSEIVFKESRRLILA